MTAPPAKPVTGIIWMLITGANFVAVTAIVKHAAAEMPAAQSAFLRYALGLVFVIPMLRPMIREGLSRQQAWLFTWRGLVHTGAVICWFYAMTRITIAEVTAMNYLSPVYVTLGAALFLGETLALRRILAVLAALLGAMVILRPGFREISPGHIAMIFTALGFAASYLLAKRMSGEMSAAVVVGWLSVTVTLGLAPFAYAVWIPPSLTQIGWMFLVAVFATAGHFSMTLAFAAAPVTVTQPVTFLQLVWAVLLGWLVFSEAIDVWVVLGGAIIMASVSFITWREHVLKNRAITPVSAATKV